MKLYRPVSIVRVEITPNPSVWVHYSRVLEKWEESFLNEFLKTLHICTMSPNVCLPYISEEKTTEMVLYVRDALNNLNKAETDRYARLQAAEFAARKAVNLD